MAFNDWAIAASAMAAAIAAVTAAVQLYLLQRQEMQVRWLEKHGVATSWHAIPSQTMVLQIDRFTHSRHTIPADSRLVNLSWLPTSQWTLSASDRPVKLILHRQPRGWQRRLYLVAPTSNGSTFFKSDQTQEKHYEQSM